MNKIFLSFALIFLSLTNIYPQRIMEELSSGLIAMRTGSNSVLISWRITGDEYNQDATYNLYRGETLIASDLSVSNFVDATSTDYSYSVAAVINGAEQGRSAVASIRGRDYFSIPVKPINGSYTNHNINDASVGDLDGDGEYEIVVKRLANDESPTSTNYHHLEAYEMDGTFMWSINLGPNLIHNVEVNFLVYDFDNDGKAEIATRTSDGMIDGTGINIGDRDKDGKISYRSTAVLNGPFWFRIHGPDYISIFDGETGAEIAWEMYIDREPMVQWGQVGQSPAQLAHRSTKCMWAVAYTDGVNPSFVISRGIYERIKLEAWHFRNGMLTQEWAFDSSPNGVATTFHGQGNHNLAAGDLDGDGRDEVTYGGMAVDDDGIGMYSTSFGHGDAGHLADINPDIPGLEYFGCQEYANGSTIPGLAIRNAANGTIQWQNLSSGDIGRSMAADIDPKHRGMEVWGSDGSGLRNCNGDLLSWTIPTSTGGGASYNFGIWWDGDVQREILDRSVIGKWNGSGTDRVATLYNLVPIAENNGSKSNPCLMADILGDWREEVIYRRADNTGLVVFVTPFSTDQRMYTLMHDANYRSAIAWQNNAYNQPPNLGFYFGGGMDTPPKPNILVGECARNMKSIQFGEYAKSTLDVFKINLDSVAYWDFPFGSAMVLYEGEALDGNYEIVHSLGSCNTLFPEGNFKSVIFKDETFWQGQQYVIKSKSSGKALGVEDGSEDDEALVSSTEANGEAYQAWILQKSEDGYYTLEVGHTGYLIETKLDLFAVQSPADATLMETQKFTIAPVPGDSRYFYIQNKSNQKCLEADPASGQISCRDCDMSNADQMFFEEFFEAAEKEILAGNSSVTGFYPNPVADVLNFKGVQVRNLKIYTLEGQLMHETDLKGANSVDVSFLTRGYYYVRFESEKGTGIGKILKE